MPGNHFGGGVYLQLAQKRRGLRERQQSSTIHGNRKWNRSRPGEEITVALRCGSFSRTLSIGRALRKATRNTHSKKQKADKQALS